MSDIHSVNEAYEQIIDALQYLEEHGENPTSDVFVNGEEALIQGKSSAIYWDETSRNWFQVP